MPLSQSAETLYSRLGRIVAKLREDLPGEVSQSDLAKLTAGMLSRSTIANIETGRHRVAVHQLYLLADALSCSLKDLLPEPSELAIEADTPHGAHREDKAAAHMMELLGRERTVTVLGKDLEGDED